MNKKEFLRLLEKELVKLEVQDTVSILEYYDELIEDQKEIGKKEKDIIDKLSIYEIVKNIKVNKTIDEAVKKPTLSNGMKALIAFLGILSLPMLIGVGALIFAIAITIAALLFALVTTVSAIFFASIASVVALLFALILGKLPIATALFCLGTVLILTGLFSALLKWVLNLTKEIIGWSMSLLKNQISKRKGGNYYE